MASSVSSGLRVDIEASNYSWVAWSPDGQRLAYNVVVGGELDIWAANADGSDPVDLTARSPADEFWPVWSPDGQRLAFINTRDGNCEVYTMNADGSDPVRLTYTAEGEYAAAWSPDGRRLAFQSWQADHIGDIWLIDSDGGNLQRLTDNPAKEDYPAWSPDGTRLAFTSRRDGNDEIYLLDVSGRNGATLDTSRAGPVYQSKPAIGVSARGDWTLTCTPAKTRSTVGFHQVRLAILPVELTAPADAYLRLSVNAQTIDLLAARSRLDPSQPTWQVIEVPLTEYGSPTTVTSLRLAGNLTGQFWLADLGLSTALPPPGTAVLESQASALPSAFSLAQNYPNPFNGSTVIRFSLPRAGEVEAFIYDLVGQQVATLAHGSRPAGTHLLTWDGRDDQGRFLASGVYLCRLRTGEQQQTRKMVVVR